MSFKMKKSLVRLLEKAHKLEGEITAWRRAIHRYPELGFQEHRTAKLAANSLREMGIQVTTEVGKTGVIGTLGKGRPAIGIRADMDALELQEANKVPYASKVPNVMHACGHDAHVAILLGVAKLLAHAKDLPEGEVRFLFQPCEETMDDDGKSGAIRMVEDGAVDGLDAIIALHVTSDYPAGRFEIADGYPTAAVDVYDATIIGKGCHDAYPHTGLDPIFLLGQVINSIHGIRAIRIDPVRPSIISISTIRAGDAKNVMPSTVEISGTIRSYDEETRGKLAEELERALSVAKALGGDYRLNLQSHGYSTRNDPEIAAIIREVILGMIGENHLLQTNPGMAGDDFSYFVRKIPGVWFQLGAQIGEEKRPHHSPVFDLDESVFPLGTAVLAGTVYRFLRKGKF
jgi:amidohydrolase